jgi:Peptidase family M23
VKTSPDYQQFAALPSDETLRIAWPTPNHCLFDAPEQFFARTRVNPDYGKPGWTRDCGKRFHRGCDVAPVNVTATIKRTRIVFTDCATNTDFESEESTYVPQDDVFCVFDGIVSEIVTDESVSDFGKHVVVAHQWPGSGKMFFTLYAHLAEVRIQESAVRSQCIGKMGQTSRSADARNWMAIAPHLHFEVRNAEGKAYDPVEFLTRFLRPVRHSERSEESGSHAG